jgi:hypothetical protein
MRQRAEEGVGIEWAGRLGLGVTSWSTTEDKVEYQPLFLDSEEARSSGTSPWHNVTGVVSQGSSRP